MNENVIILDQVAIWTPKASNGFTTKKSPVGTAYKTKTGILKQSAGLLVRAAKNYYLGGDATEDEKIEEPAKVLEAENDEVMDKEEIEGLEDEKEKTEKADVPVKAEEVLAAVESPKLKFCLFVRSERSAGEVERKLDYIAKQITESQVLAAIGRSQTHGFNSFEYTNYNLEDID